MLQDVLDALVAFGTIAVAGVTAWLAFSSRNTTREAYRTRVDASGPRLVVVSFDVEPQAVTVRQPAVAGASPADVEPGLEWDMTQHGHALLGVLAFVMLTNEGARTALFRVETPDEVELTRRPSTGGPGEDLQPFLLVSAGEMGVNGWAQILPGVQMQLGLVWWQSALRWAELWSESSPPTTTVTLIARDTTGSVEDRCELRFGAHVIMPKPIEDGWMTAGRSLSSGVPKPAPEAVAVTGLTQRSYPAI